MSTANVNTDGDHVVLLIDGHGWRLPYAAALDLGRALIAKAREADEFANANRVIADAALAVRAGAPFGLSNDPRINAEAKKSAEWDRHLRRALPTPDRVVFGTPTVTLEQPK